MSDYYEELSERRKKAQAEGLYPEWYTTAGYSLFEQKYRYMASGFKEQAQRIAKTAAKHLGKYAEEYEKKFFDLIWNGWLSCSTPVLSNMGTDRGMPVSCEGGYVEDSIDGFYTALHEQAVLSKHGFGTSVYLGDIRPRGTPISVGGKASGVMPVLKNFVQMSRDVSQGSNRRGAIASYIPIDHGDFWEVVEYLEHEPDDLNIGWNISDAFIQRLEDKDEEAVKRFKRVLRVKMVTGRGYFFFPDKVNRKRPESYMKNDLKVLAANLCAEITLHSSPEYSFTCVLSSMNLAKYDEWKDTDAVFTATVFLDCVASEFIEKAEGVHGLEKARAFTIKGRALGLGVCGYSTYLQEHMMPFEGFEAHNWNNLVFKEIAEKSNEASKWLAKEFGEPEWCRGLGVRNTHKCVSGDTKILTKEGQIQINNLVGKTIEVWNGEEWSEVTPFETGISELLKVTFSNGMELKCTPDHKFLVATPKRDTSEEGGLRLVEVEASSLRIGDCLPKFRTEAADSGNILPFAYESGLFCGDGSISNARGGKYPRNELRLYGKKMELKNCIRWKSTTTWGGESCVRGYLPDEVLEKYKVPFGYCLTSKLEWLCGLIDADGSSTSTGICISMKEEKFAKEVALLVQECGGDISVFRAKRSGGYSTAAPYYWVVNISMFSCNKIFKDIKPKRVVVYVSNKNRSKIGSYQMTEVVSVEKLQEKEMTYCFTEPKKNRGVFNGVLTKQCAIAPTKSTALLMGGVSEGINPDPAMTYTQAGAGGESQRINPSLLKIMKSRGKDTKKYIQEIIDARGSVQGVDWLTPEEKLVFKTAFEIDMSAVLRKGSSRARYLDQWQSLNFFFSAEEDPAYIAKIHRDAFLDENILALYYCYSKAGIAAAKGECIACQ